MPVDHGTAERFARANWRSLAAAAWRFCLSWGPGALIVDWAVVQRWSERRPFRFQPRYATTTESAEVNVVIADYDPETAIVIAFSDERSVGRGAGWAAEPSQPVAFRFGTALAAMTITAEPPPPDAHRARGH